MDIRLDPDHAAKLELRAKVAVTHSEVADRRLICLINDDRTFIELSKDMPAALRPSLKLGQIGLCNQIHAHKDKKAEASDKCERH